MTRYQGDVVVIGGGLAGIVTALELVEAGKSVVLLDRATEDRFGGLAKRSFGGLFFVDSPEQRRTGIRDSVDLALADWVGYGELGPEDRWPRAWAEAFVYGCTEQVRGYLYRHGVRFLPGVNWTERGYFVPGNSVPRFHVAWGTGQGIVRPLVERLRSHAPSGRLRLCFGHRVRSLVREAGRFVGCEGTTDAGLSFEARGDAVVIAAGGLAGSDAQVRKHWNRAELGEPPATLLCGSMPEADGAMMDEAAHVGARVQHLEKMWNYAAGVRHHRPLFPNHGLSLVPGKSALWVDATGKRFTDPPLVGSYDTLLLMQRICATPWKYSWQVLNHRILAREIAVSGEDFNAEVRNHDTAGFLLRLVRGSADLADEFLARSPDFVYADSVDRLARRMNDLTGEGLVDARTLEHEIARYDAQLDRPKKLWNDDQLRRIEHARTYFGDRLRTCDGAKIADPKSMPLVAIRLSVVTRKSLGGIACDLEGRALDAEDRPLPGLYAVGEAAGFGGGGMHGKRALEGTFLGGCIFSGRTVARALLTGRGAGRGA